MTASAAQTLSAGDIVDERYRIVELLAEGGMGSVYIAEELLLKRRVALKRLRIADLDQAAVRTERLMREAQAAAAIDHPNCVKIYGVGEHLDAIYVAMEFIEGADLAHVLASSGPIEGKRLARLMIQLCDVLAAAHEQGVLHRDIKTDNIMLVGKPPDERIKLVDFGLALPVEHHHDRLTREGVVMGTPGYLSPEQCLAKSVDERSDLYAAGIVLFECLCGLLPFYAFSPNEVLVQQVYSDPPSPSTLAPDVEIHPALEALALWAMAKDPGARPQTAREYRQAFEEALALMEQGQLPADKRRKVPVAAGQRQQRLAGALVVDAGKAAATPAGAPPPIDVGGIGAGVPISRVALPTLVVEAAPQRADSLTVLLRARGESVVTAPDEAEVLKKLEDRVFGAIVLDLTGVIESMASWCDVLRQSFGRTPVLVVGPDEATDSMARSIELGFSDYVPKSLAKDKLHKRLTGALKRRKRQLRKKH
jgi:tRNA A-37 threonylcarbamoyl transferase component Bud32/CheY-like chemotaxis protein